jgi:hypothetical protein
VENRPLHERVRDHLDHSGLDFVQLAEAMGWSERKAKRKVLGQTRWLAEDIEILADVLEKPIAALYRGRGRA